MNEDIIKDYFNATDVHVADPDRIDNLIKNAKLKAIGSHYTGGYVIFQVDGFSYYVLLDLIPFEDRQYFVNIHSPYKGMKLKTAVD